MEMYFPNLSQYRLIYTRGDISLNVAVLESLFKQCCYLLDQFKNIWIFYCKVLTEISLSDWCCLHNLVRETNTKVAIISLALIQTTVYIPLSYKISSMVWNNVREGSESLLQYYLRHIIESTIDMCLMMIDKKTQASIEAQKYSLKANFLC